LGILSSNIGQAALSPVFAQDLEGGINEKADHADDERE
jgi:hypothetical protein